MFLKVAIISKQLVKQVCVWVPDYTVAKGNVAGSIVDVRLPTFVVASLICQNDIRERDNTWCFFWQTLGVNS